MQMQRNGKYHKIACVWKMEHFDKTKMRSRSATISISVQPKTFFGYGFVFIIKYY